MVLAGNRFHTSAAIVLSDDASRETWIQVAVTGTFHSPVYGKFSISKDDLTTILRNYETEHPLKPTELMLDYEHLSANPQAVGDGAAAGWFKELQLRQNGDELWARVELTDDAAEAVRKKKYRYISPEIHRRYKSKRTGKEVGYTLMAAALTNRPFLEGMQPLVLSDTAGHKLALADAEVLPYDERERRIREAFEAANPPSYRDGGIDYSSWKWVVMVYEDRIVYRSGGRLYRQSYNFNADLSVTFTGTPVEVVLTDTEVVTLNAVEQSDIILVLTASNSGVAA